MAIRSIRRQSTNPLGAAGTPNTAPIYVDSDDNKLKMIPAGSGTTEIDIVDVSTTQTLTNKTLTTPTVSGGTFTGATFTGNLAGDIKFCATQFDAVTGSTGTTLTNVVGLTGFSLVAGATYAFEVMLSGVSTTNCGMKIGFGYTTLTATSLESSALGYTAAAVVGQHTTTATTGMTLFGVTASAIIGVRIVGQLIVNAAGTLAVQAAQNAAHADTTSVYAGSWAKFTRVS